MGKGLDADASSSQGAADVDLEMRRAGFVVVPDILSGDRLAEAARAYDLAMARGAAPELRVGSDTTRLHGLMDHGDEFRRLSLHPVILAACRSVIGHDFRLSGLLARTVRPRSRAGVLHVDVEAGSDDWPMVGFILMVDAFTIDNGATRFVPGSHESPAAPIADRAGQVVARGAAGSLILYDGSVWHGHSANQTDRPRRSVQGAYIRGRLAE
jgi:ectoine hydroxylase-related dioxygenase (phytanoyl-CoA dioxygenase family)